MASGCRRRCTSKATAERCSCAGSRSTTRSNGSTTEDCQLPTPNCQRPNENGGGGERRERLGREEAELTEAISRRVHRGQRQARLQCAKVCEAVGAALRAAWIERRHADEWPVQQAHHSSACLLSIQAPARRAATHRRTHELCSSVSSA